MLFGPRMRSRCGLAALSIRWRSLPCSALSRPAVMTMAARVPMPPRSRIRPGRVAGGVQMTARSGAFGSWLSL